MADAKKNDEKDRRMAFVRLIMSAALVGAIGGSAVTTYGTPGALAAIAFALALGLVQRHWRKGPARPASEAMPATVQHGAAATRNDTGGLDA